MAEETEVNADPSMEEILASIRKIISDDKPAEDSAEQPEEPKEQEDVLELTQIIQEDGSVEEAEEPPPEEPSVAEPEPEPEPVSPAEPLVSDDVVTSAASTLSSLANTVEIERLASAPGSATLVGNSRRTLEDMVIELMRPLLRDWLDKNLQTVVECLVQKEIDRISKKS
ncbi:MAG: DUF2497 domain-containing protein [Alphaproteobacteria bacterium]|nr:DUF2497 domain-containing protein [Alphaproteobacteria bacterium]